MEPITNGNAISEGIGSLFSPVAWSGLMAAGIKILQIIGTLLLCWILIKVSSAVAKKFFQTQAQRDRLSMSERKARTLNSITSSVLKYVIYFIGIFSIL